MEVSELGSNEAGIRKYTEQCDNLKRFCKVSFSEIENIDKTWVYQVTAIFDYFPWHGIGSDTWTSGISPTVQKTIEFRRMEVKKL